MKTTGDGFEVYSIRLVKTGYFVKNMSCGRIVLAQDTTLITCVLTVVVMTHIR
jgi:hypothetical protein